MTEYKHTKCHLVVQDPALPGYKCQLYAPEGNGHLVATLDPINSNDENTLANANRLALSWNSHDALVEALKAIAAFTDEGANAFLEKTGSFSAFDEPGAVQIARAALAIATGQESGS